tara:strand:- start:478 stop:1533 length:1056 start_codon:yes stop_codon:yes gene_type:complete
MFDHYLYVSSTTKSFRDHFKNAAKKYISNFNLDSNSFIVDIGSNDGVALVPFKEKNINVLGVEPAKNICDIANEKNINTINSYFNIDVAKDIIKSYKYADIVTASNVFAHSNNLEEIAKAAFELLKKDGVFIIEVQYLLDTIKDLTFDNIYHEHVNYWSVISLKNFFSRLGYYVVNVEHIDTHGGSIRVYIENTCNNLSSNVDTFIKNENEFGLNKYQTYLDFADKVEQAKLNVVRNIKNLKNKGLTLIGYGSPAKATTSLNYYGITSNEINFIIDDNPLKHNKILPGVRIPIYSREKLSELLPDVIIVMAWNFIKEIKENNQDLINKGVQFISIKELQEESISIQQPQKI